MTRRVALVLDDPAGPVTVGEVAERGVTLGRSPASDLVFPSERVSWQHAAITVENGIPWVRDLGSRNGTFVNGERLGAPRVICDGDVLGISPAVALRVRVMGTAEPAVPRALVVEDVATGVRYPVRSERFTIGASGELRTSGAGATLLVTGPDDLWLGVDGEDVPVAVDVPFVVDGRTYAVRRADLERSPTLGATSGQPLYDLVATLNGDSGAEATLVDPDSGRSHRVEGENRALLLYILGRRTQADTDAGTPGGDRGWMSDDDVATALWGRGQASRDDNALHVLIHRVRKEVAAAGFDPWFIEKRRRCIRARFSKVSG